MAPSHQADSRTLRELQNMVPRGLTQEHPKRRGSAAATGDIVPAKKSKKQQQEKKVPQKVPEPANEEDDSEEDDSDEDENPQTTYARRIIMRNKMFKTGEQIETAQRRIEHGDDDSKAIHRAVKQYAHSDILKAENRDIVNGRDLSIDSILGDRLSRVLLIKAGKISTGADKFKFTNYAENIKERGTFGEFFKEDLDGIFDESLGFKSVSCVDFGAAPKINKKPANTERQPRKKAEKGELVNMKGKQTAEINEEKDADFTKQLDHVMEAFRRTLKERKTKRINYYEFVIDPEDFGNTIQNSFCTSFLLKDQVLFLERKDDDVYPFLRKLSKAEKEAAEEAVVSGKPLPSHQFVNTFTYAKWKGLIEKLELKEPIITTRTTADDDEDEDDE